MVNTDELITFRNNKYQRNNFDPKTFLGKTTVIPGTTGSGKSFMANSILYAIAPYVSTLTVFSASAENDKSFPMNRYTHPSLIYKRLDLNILQNHLDKSEEITGRYNSYTELPILKAAAIYLDKRYPKYISRVMKLIKVKIDNLKNELKKLKDAAKPVKDKVLEEISVLYKRYLTLFKLILIKHEVFIENLEVVKVLQYVDYIIYSVILINDLTASYSALTKKERSIFDDIIDRGRHSGITLIMLIHSWSGFGTNIRNSPHNIIFTNVELANSYVSLQKLKGSDSRAFNDAIEGIISKDRALPDDQKKYNCILYDRPRSTFYFIRADPRGKQTYVGIPYFNKITSRK